MKRHRGITMVEVIVVVAVVVIGLVVLVWVVGTKARIIARTQHDASQLHILHGAFALGAQGGPDSYLLPSTWDAANTTVLAEDPLTKNTTANVYSQLIYFGYMSPDVLVSPAENNPRVQIFDQYQYESPATAAVPDQALWDPAFSVDFVNGIGGTSYAHMIPAARLGGRSPRWTNAFQTSEPLASIRGPHVSAIQRSGKKITGVTYDARSNTMSFFGSSSRWRGNVVYQDGHTQFETTLSPFGGIAPTEAPWEDVLFFDEYLPTDGPDHPYFINEYLGIFTKAGPTMADYGPIWD